MSPLPAALLSILLLATAGCTTAPPGPTVLEKNADGKHEIHMVGQAFRPKNAQVPVNSTVVWILDSGSPHDVQSDDHTSFSSGPGGGMKAVGATFEHRFEKRGMYTYHCEVHQSTGMVATLHVV